MRFEPASVFPPPRPHGCAPFQNWANLIRWFSGGQIGKCPIDLMTEKIDGFQLIVVACGPESVRLFTKAGVALTRNSPGVLGEMYRVYHTRFSHVRPQAIRHPRAGRAIAIFAEFALLRTDEVAQNSECECELEDLGAMMRKSIPSQAQFTLRCFHCSFLKDGSRRWQRVPLAERLDLCRQRFGEDHVVRVLIDARRPVTQEHMDIAHECYSFKEGVVISQGGVLRKDKALRPVCMQLVAVGMSVVDGVKLPTHFFWAIPEAGVLYVPLVDDRRYLFEDGRKNKGKIQLQTTMFELGEDGRHRILAAPGNFQTETYKGLIGLMGVEFVDARALTACEAILDDGRRVVIGQNRRLKFNDPNIVELRFLARPRLGVIGTNQLWMTGAKTPHVSGVHFQAPQLLATSQYGHANFRALADTERPTPAAIVVWLATKASRDLAVHAAAVFGPDAPSLVHGDEIEPVESEYETPAQSEDEE